jgi:hypothetical protein
MRGINGIFINVGTTCDAFTVKQKVIGFSKSEKNSNCSSDIRACEASNNIS